MLAYLAVPDQRVYDDPKNRRRGIERRVQRWQIGEGHARPAIIRLHSTGRQMRAAKNSRRASGMVRVRANLSVRPRNISPNPSAATKYALLVRPRSVGGRRPGSSAAQ